MKRILPSFKTDFETLLPLAAQIEVLQKQLYEECRNRFAARSFLGMLLPSPPNLSKHQP